MRRLGGDGPRRAALTEPLAPPAAGALRAALLRWYRRARRDLPFRRTRDPWAVWVSEAILQQTTVAAGVPRWERFLARFPTVASLAAAGEREVLAEWSGLGYYARARNLHRAARAVVAGGGEVPRTVDGLRALPGVGPYTAAAVASIAFGVPAPLVDGNVARVLARLLAVPGDVRSGRARAAVEEAAAAFLNRRSPGDHNQALMELGAVVCLPRAPRCESCPLAGACRARASGRPEAFPVPRARKAPVHVRLAAGLARRRGRVVLVEDRILVPGHLVLPLVEVPDGADAGAALRAAWPRLAGRRAARLVSLGTVRHAVLERRYAVEAFAVTEGPRDGAAPGSRALLPEELANEPRGGLLPKLLAVSARSAATSVPARARRGPARPRRTGG
ncbi:MAG: A/G-specific adenine glycosylase [Thermoanaerobaculia bacterium]